MLTRDDVHPAKYSKTVRGHVTQHVTSFDIPSRSHEAYIWQRKWISNNTDGPNRMMIRLFRNMQRISEGFKSAPTIWRSVRCSQSGSMLPKLANPPHFRSAASFSCHRLHPPVTEVYDLTVHTLAQGLPSISPPCRTWLRAYLSHAVTFRRRCYAPGRLMSVEEYKVCVSGTATYPFSFTDSPWNLPR